MDSAAEADNQGHPKAWAIRVIHSKDGTFDPDFSMDDK
jgi:hypothetical protein